MEVVETIQMAVPVSKGFADTYHSNDSFSARCGGGSVSGCGTVVMCSPEDSPVCRMLSPSTDGGTGGGGSIGGEGSGDEEMKGRGQLLVDGGDAGLGMTASLHGSSPLTSLPATTVSTSTSTTNGSSRKTVHDHTSQHQNHRPFASDMPPSHHATPTSPSAVRLTPSPPTPVSDLITTTISLSVMADDNAVMDNDKHSVSQLDNGDEDSVNNNGQVSPSPGSVTTTSTTATSAVTVAVGMGDSGGGAVRNLRARGQRKFLPEKTRHKRQTLQDMTRPLKQWLLRHKDNPYPSKAQKMDLVSKSQMTLTQVSNWFANARRRLKNTVKQPDLTWASRIRLYNSCVEGNAELFSICSDDSCPESDDDMMEHRQSDTFHDDVTDSLTSSRTATPDVTAPNGEACGSFNHNSNGSSQGDIHSNTNHHHQHHHHHHHHSCHHPPNNNSSSSSNTVSPSAHHQHAGLDESCASFPKYKHSILHRYLSDAHQQALLLDEDSVAKSRDRHHSSSTGSRDFEELSTSSVSSPAHEPGHHDHLDDFSETMVLRRRTSDVSSNTGEEDLYWKEIGAALALTSLARGRAINT